MSRIPIPGVRLTKSVCAVETQLEEISGKVTLRPRKLRSEPVSRVRVENIPFLEPPLRSCKDRHGYSRQPWAKVGIEPQPRARETRLRARETQPRARETQPRARETQPRARETQPRARETLPRARDSGALLKTTSSSARDFFTRNRQTQ